MSRAGATIALSLLVTAACGSSSSHVATSTSTPGSSPVSTPSTTAAGETHPGSGASAVTLTDADNHRHVTLHVGERLTLVLGSTYWTVQDSSNPEVLRRAGDPVVEPQLRGCVPGQGCGTVTAAFTGVGAGDAVVTATRTTCGEAMACTGAAGLYRVDVRVT